MMVEVVLLTVVLCAHIQVWITCAKHKTINTETEHQNPEMHRKRG